MSYKECQDTNVIIRQRASRFMLITDQGKCARNRTMDDRMTTFERRQRIIEMLEEQSVVKVVALAELFDVSEGTIRNDLAALEEENRLRRVRGGATSAQQEVMLSDTRLDRTTVNVQAKRRIAAGPRI